MVSLLMFKKKMDINERVIIRQYFFKTIHSVDGFYIFLTKRKII